jgi:glycosyltransferase involved in cell wall biosynthesis
MQNIGLLMTYNEEDIIEEMMIEANKYFDVILAMDGSTDKTAEIIQSFDNVKYLIKDQDLYPQRTIRDGARQFLLEKAQSMFGCEGWFTLLHGDEIFLDDPNDIAKRAQAKGAEITNWHMLNFFLHTSQRGTVYDPNKQLQEQLLYYQPGGLEVRQFRNKPGIHYNLNQHGNLLPYGIKPKPYLDYPVIKHYVNRFPEHRIKFKPTSSFSDDRDAANDSQLVEDACFIDRLSDDKKQVRHYDGSFLEFEPGSRPSFFKQWLSWHKYAKVNMGMFGILFKDH